MQEAIIETPRLRMRPLTQGDLSDLAEILQDPRVMVAYEGPFADADVQAWLTRQLERYEHDGIGLWALIAKETGAFIGQCGLTWQDTGDARVLEVGYLLKHRYWHQGYATEAAITCRRYAFDILGADAVYSIIRDTNEASIRVAQRNGMRPAGQIIKQYRGAVMPHILYRITREEDETLSCGGYTFGR